MICISHRGCCTVHAHKILYRVLLLDLTSLPQPTPKTNVHSDQQKFNYFVSCRVWYMYMMISVLCLKSYLIYCSFPSGTELLSVHSGQWCMELWDSVIWDLVTRSTAFQEGLWAIQGKECNTQPHKPYAWLTLYTECMATLIGWSRCVVIMWQKLDGHMIDHMT